MTFETVRRSFSMLSRKRQRYWLLLVPLAVAAAALESLVAVLTYELLKILSQPDELVSFPGPGPLREWIPSGLEVTGVTPFIVLVAVCFIVKNVFVLVVEVARNWTVQRSVSELSKRMLAGYLDAPYTLHLSRNSADLIRTVMGSVDAAFSPVLGAALQVVSETLIALGLVIVLFSTSPGVTSMAIAILALGLAPLLLLTRHLVTRWGAREHALRQHTLHQLQQALGGIKEVKTMSLESFFSTAFSASMDTLARLRHSFFSLNAAPRLLIETTMIGGMLLLMAVVLSWGTESRELLSLFGLYGYTAFRLIPSANRLMMHINHIRHGSAAVRELYADYEAFRPATASPVAPAGSATLEKELRFHDVSFRYPNASRESVRHVELTIQRGECIGLAGRTGAGKSTLVDLLLGLLSPSEGRITLDGEPLASNLEGWRRQIGYVPQHIFLIDDTILSNVAFGVPAASIDTDRAQAAIEKAQLGGLVSSLPNGLHTLVGERGTRLSGGERQRLGIARALYREPSVVIFDEATSALDNRTERELMDALSSLRRDRTLILIAHRLSTIQNCDRVLFMEAGKLVAIGPYAELLEGCPEFRALAQGTT